MRGYVLLKDMIFKKDVLLEDMSNMRRGFKEWHILQEDMQGGHVFHEDMFYGLTCFLEDKSYRRTSLIGGQVL